MPEMSFRIRWPDRAEIEYYSPSLVVRDLLTEGETLALPDFLQRARKAMQIASDRVAEKYGFPCARARATLAAIEQHAQKFTAHEDAQITVTEFSP
jgi:uncharacterized repeat protein (TIGR04042 family)